MEAAAEDGEVQSKGGGEKVVTAQPSPQQPPEAKSSPTRASHQEGSIERGLAADQEETTFGPSAESWLDRFHKPDSFLTLASPSYKFEAELQRCSESGFQSIITTGSMQSQTLNLGCDEVGGEFGTGEDCEGDYESEQPKRDVRRPMNAFLIFCKRHRSIVRAKYPDKDNRSVTKILGDLWAHLSKDEKAVYTKLAKQYKDAFMKANPGYTWHNTQKLPQPAKMATRGPTLVRPPRSLSASDCLDISAQGQAKKSAGLVGSVGSGAGEGQIGEDGSGIAGLNLLLMVGEKAQSPVQPEVTAIKRKLPIPELTVANSLLQLAEIASENRLLLEGPLLSGTPPKKRARHYSYSEFGHSDISQKPLPVSTLLITPAANSALNAAKPSPSLLPTPLNYPSPSGMTSHLGVPPSGVTSQLGVLPYVVTNPSGTSPNGVTSQSGVFPFSVTSQSGTSPYGVTSQSGLLLSMPVAEQPPTGGVVGSWERLKSMATASMKNAGLSVGQTLPGSLSSDIGIPPKKKFTKLQTLAQDHSLVAATGLTASIISVTATPVVLASPGVQAMTPVAGMAVRGALSAEPTQIPALQPGNSDYSDQNDNAVYLCGKRVVDHIMDRLLYTGGNNNGTVRHEGGVGSLPSSLENPCLGDKVIAADLSGWEKSEERLGGSSVGKLVSETGQKPQNLVEKVIKEAYNIDVGQAAQTADAVFSMPVPSAPSSAKLPFGHLAGPPGPALGCGLAALPTDDLTPSSILTTLSFKPVRLEPTTQPILSIVEPSVPRVASLTEVVGAGDGTGALRMAASSFVRDLAAAAVRGPPSAAGNSLFVSREKAASAASSASAAPAAAVPWYTNLCQLEKTCKSPVASAPVPHPETETRANVEQSSASFAASGVAATEHKEQNSDFGGHDDEENSQPLRKSLRPNRGQRYNQLIREGIIQPCKDRLAAHRQEPVQSQLEPEPAPEPLADRMYAEDSQEEGDEKSTEDRPRVTLKRSISESDTNSEEKRYCTGDFDLEAKIHALPPCSLEVMRRRQARKRSDSESKKSCSSSSLSQGAPLSPVFSTHLTAVAKEEVKGEDPTVQATVKTSSSLSSAVGEETQATTTPTPAVTEADRSVLVMSLVPPTCSTVSCSTRPAATVTLASSTDSELRTGSQKRKMRKCSIRKVSNDGTDAGIASTLPRVRDRTLSSSPVLHPLPEQPPPSSILPHAVESTDLQQIADRPTTTQSNDLLSSSCASSVPPLAAGTELSPSRAVTDDVSVVGAGTVKLTTGAWLGQSGRLPSPVSAAPLVSARAASLCSSSVVCTSAVSHGGPVGSRTVLQAHPSRSHLSDLAAEPGVKSSPSVATKSPIAGDSWDLKKCTGEESGSTRTVGASLPAAFTENSAAAFLSETASSPAGAKASLSCAPETGKPTASPPAGAADCASAKPAVVKAESITMLDKLTQLIKEEINRGDDDDRSVPGEEAMGATARAGAVKVERSAASCPERDRSRPNLVADAAVKVETGNSNVNCFTMFRNVKTEDQDCKTCMPVSGPVAVDKQTASLVRLTHPAPDHQTLLSQIWLGPVNPEDRKPSCWDSEETISTYPEKKTVLVPEHSKPARLMLDQVATTRAPEIYHPAVTVPLTEASRSRIFITVTTAGYEMSNQASPPLSVTNSTESTFVTNVSKSVALDPVVSSTSTTCEHYLAGYGSSASEVWNAASKLPDPDTTDTRQEVEENENRKKREGLHFTLECVSSARVEEKDVKEMEGVDLEEGVLRTIPGSPMAVVHS